MNTNDYKTSIVVAAIISIIGGCFAVPSALFFAIGFVGIIFKSSLPSFIQWAFVAGGAIGIFLGLMNIVCGQLLRAVLDTANNTAKTVELLDHLLVKVGA